MTTTPGNGNGAHLDVTNRCLIEAATSIISTVCNLQPNLKTPPAESKEEKILAVVALMGDLNMFLGLPPQTAGAMAARFAGFEIPFESSDMADAIGELANMTAGDVKTRLDKFGIKASISVPSVQRGPDLCAAHPGLEQIKSNYFSTDSGDFTAGLCTKKKA